MKKAICYINQFFAGIGGEDKADHQPEIRDGAAGSTMALAAALKDIEITHTIVCGDNFMGSHREDAISIITDFIKDKEFDVFIAGPAFRAGRYGVACGEICRAVQNEFNVPVFSSMNDENPGAEMFRKEMVIFEGGKSAAAMRKDAGKMADYVSRFLAGEPVGHAEKEGYFGRGKRHMVFDPELKPASDRAVEMLMSKLSGKPFTTELPIPKVDRVAIAPAIKDLSKATIAVINTGGIVPVDNPDRIQSASATRWGRYDISEMERLEGGVFKTIHAGYDPMMADSNPNVCVPLDVLRDMEKAGKIGKLHEFFYSTVGTGTTQKEAARMAQEMIPPIQEANVDGVLLVSTWGTCTRCGATIVKEIEKTGMPVVQIANLVPVATTTGSNRIVPGFAIPYPLGNPELTPEAQYKMRHHRVEVALDALATHIDEQTVFKVKI